MVTACTSASHTFQYIDEILCRAFLKLLARRTDGPKVNRQIETSAFRGPEKEKSVDAWAGCRSSAVAGLTRSLPLRPEPSQSGPLINRPIGGHRPSANDRLTYGDTGTDEKGKQTD